MWFMWFCLWKKGRQTPIVRKGTCFFVWKYYKDSMSISLQLFFFYFFFYGCITCIISLSPLGNTCLEWRACHIIQTYFIVETMLLSGFRAFYLFSCWSKFVIPHSLLVIWIFFICTWRTIWFIFKNAFEFERIDVWKCIDVKRNP